MVMSAFSEFSLLLIISAIAGAISDCSGSGRGTGDDGHERDDQHGMRLKQAGAPTVLYPMRDAVDYTVEHFAALIRPKENAE